MEEEPGPSTGEGEDVKKVATGEEKGDGAVEMSETQKEGEGGQKETEVEAESGGKEEAEEENKESGVEEKEKEGVSGACVDGRKGEGLGAFLLNEVCSSTAPCVMFVTSDLVLEDDGNLDSILDSLVNMYDWFVKEDHDKILQGMTIMYPHKQKKLYTNPGFGVKQYCVFFDKNQRKRKEGESWLPLEDCMEWKDHEQHVFTTSSHPNCVFKVGFCASKVVLSSVLTIEMIQMVVWLAARGNAGEEDCAQLKVVLYETVDKIKSYCDAIEIESPLVKSAGNPVPASKIKNSVRGTSTVDSSYRRQPVATKSTSESATAADSPARVETPPAIPRNVATPSNAPTPSSRPAQSSLSKKQATGSAEDFSDVEISGNMLVLNSVTYELPPLPLKPKQPRGPKMPVTSYMLWSQESFQKVFAENKDLTFANMGRLLGQKWREMSEKEREPYVNMALEGRKRYTEEKAQFEASAEYKNYYIQLAKYDEAVSGRRALVNQLVEEAKEREREERARKKQERSKASRGREASSSKRSNSKNQGTKRSYRVPGQYPDTDVANVHGVEFAEVDENIYSVKHLANARYERNNRCMAELFDNRSVDDLYAELGVSALPSRGNKENRAGEISAEEAKARLSKGSNLTEAQILREKKMKHVLENLTTTEISSIEKKYDMQKRSIEASRKSFETYMSEFCSSKHPPDAERLERLKAMYFERIHPYGGDLIGKPADLPDFSDFYENNGDPRDAPVQKEIEDENDDKNSQVPASFPLKRPYDPSLISPGNVNKYRAVEVEVDSERNEDISKSIFGRAVGDRENEYSPVFLTL